MTKPRPASSPATRTAVGDSECRYPGHAGYGSSEDTCIHCNLLTPEEIRDWLSRRLFDEGSY